MRQYINKGTLLSTRIIGKIIEQYRLNTLPDLIKARQYYEGKQKITQKTYADASREPNRVVKNYVKQIVNNYEGYILGNPITYTAAEQGGNIDELIEIFKWNDVENADIELLHNALIYGVAPQVCYINENKEKKFKSVNPQTTIPVYSSDLDQELLYVIRIFEETNWNQSDCAKVFYVDVYDKQFIYHYRASNDLTSLTLIGQTEHYFGDIPFTFLYLVDDSPIFGSIVSLQDAYNEALSNSIDDLEAFTDAYLVLKNTTLSADDLFRMKEKRTLILDDNDDAFFLTKSATDSDTQNILATLNEAIHSISNSPDFASPEFNGGVSSGIAIRFKTISFDNTANAIENRMRKALQNRIYLLNRILSLMGSTSAQVNIQFTENLPVDTDSVIDGITKLRGLVSDQTLISQLPFVNDVQAEMEKISAQNDSQIYDFGHEHNEEE